MTNAVQHAFRPRRSIIRGVASKLGVFFCFGGEISSYKQHEKIFNFLSLQVSYSKILKNHCLDFVFICVCTPEDLV